MESKTAPALRPGIFGSKELRGLSPSALNDGNSPTRFRWMFPELAQNPACTLPVQTNGDLFPAVVDDLVSLAAGMRDEGLSPDSGVPSGFTYLAQFIDHDLTLDRSSISSKLVDPAGLLNFRTPRFDLDSLYGAGPGDDSFLYVQLPPADKPWRRGVAMVLSENGFNLPRNPEGIAVMPESRNDENLFIGQLHTAFIRFHNAVVEIIHDANPSMAGEQLFLATRQTVVRHYQWIVRHEFLPKVLRPDIVTLVFDNNYNPIYTPEPNDVWLPVEFSSAAYRFGHSLVRDDYPVINNEGGASLSDLFNFTGLGGSGGSLGSRWTVDWHHLFDFPGSGAQVNFTRAFDTEVAAGLHDLDPSHSGHSLRLPSLTLRRSYSYRIAAGQCVASHLGYAPLTQDELLTNHPADGTLRQRPYLLDETPLWYYILKEAEIRENGARLGEVGSRIVAEVFAGLLRADQTSIFNPPNAWTPTLPGSVNGQFSMTDLLTIAFT